MLNRILGAGLIVLLLALGFSVYQLNSLQKQVEDLQKKTEELKVIAERPPIQFVGTFPDNMKSITKLANDTKVKLLIVGDYCAYGHYSNPDGYADYIRALEFLADKNISVDMYLYDDETTRKTLISQFTTDFKKIENSQKFKHYFDDVHHGDLRRPRTLSEFESVMNAQQKKCVDELSAKGVSIHRTISNTLPLFIWLRDGDEAVFSVYNLGDNAREVSIATKDKTLVNLLEEIYTQAVRRSAILATDSAQRP
jgi:hypothetical protein